MKRIHLFSFITLLVLASSASAQGFKLAVHAGANLNKIDGQSFDDGFAFGYHLGVAPEIMFAKKWGIQPELMFSQTNTKTTTHFKDIYNPSLNDLRDVKLKYLSIPILLTYRPIKVFSLQAGPQFSALMNQDKTLLEDGKSAFKQGDFAMVAGAQLYFLGFRVYGRYAVGLANINDIDQRDKWKSQTIQLGAGFTF